MEQVVLLLNSVSALENILVQIRCVSSCCLYGINSYLTIDEVCTLLGRGEGEESRVKARPRVMVIIQVVSLWGRLTVL